MPINKGYKCFVRSKYSPIGIDLGSSMVNMLQLSCRAGRIIIHQKLSMPAPSGALIEGQIPDMGTLAYTLAEAKKKVNWHGGSINFSLDSTVCQLRLVTMPRLNARDLYRAMELEAEKLFPYLNDNRRISYTLISKHDQNNYRLRKYLLAIAPQDILAAYNIVAKKAGLRLLSLEAAPLALIRALAADSTLRRKITKPLQVIIDVDNKRSILIIVYLNSYMYHRIIALGIDHFISQSRQANKPLSSKLHDSLSAFSREIAHSIEYGLALVNLKQKEFSLAVNLCSYVTNIPALIKQLQRQLHLDLELLIPLESLEIRTGDQINNAYNCNALFTKAFGLAIKDWLYSN